MGARYCDQSVAAFAPDLAVMLSSSRDDPGLFQRAICSVLVDRLEPPRRHPNAHVFVNFGHPDAMLVQIRMKFAPHVLGHVPPDAAFFLRQTPAMNNAAARDARPSNTANLRHKGRGD